MQTAAGDAIRRDESEGADLTAVLDPEALAEARKALEGTDVSVADLQDATFGKLSAELAGGGANRFGNVGGGLFAMGPDELERALFTE